MNVLDEYITSQIQACLGSLNKEADEYFKIVFEGYLCGIQECFHEDNIVLKLAVNLHESKVEYATKVFLRDGEEKKLIATIYSDSVEDVTQ